MNFQSAMPLLFNTYGDILKLGNSELEGEMFKYNATKVKEIGFNPLMYPNIMKLITFRDTIAVSSAECERSFSTINRVKTAGRSTMSD